MGKGSITSGWTILVAKSWLHLEVNWFWNLFFEEPNIASPFQGWRSKILKNCSSPWLFPKRCYLLFNLVKIWLWRHVFKNANFLMMAMTHNNIIHWYWGFWEPSSMMFIKMISWNGKKLWCLIWNYKNWESPNT